MGANGAGGVRTAKQIGDDRRGRVWSTGCLLVVAIVVFFLVVIVPALLWTIGIAFGQ